MDFQKLMKTAAANQHVAQKRVRTTSLNLRFFEFISQKILSVTGNVSSVAHLRGRFRRVGHLSRGPMSLCLYCVPPS